MSYEKAQQTVLEAWVPGVGIEANPSHTDFFASDHLVNTRGLLAIGEIEKAKEYFDIWQSSLYHDYFSPHYMLDKRKVMTGFVHGRLANRTTKIANGRKVSPYAGAPSWNIVALEIFDSIKDTSSEEEAVKWLTGYNRIQDLIGSTISYAKNRYHRRVGRYFQLHPNELTLGAGILSVAQTNPSKIFEKYDGYVAIEDTFIQRQETITRSGKKGIKKMPQLHAYDPAVDAQAKQNIEALRLIGVRLLNSNTKTDKLRNIIAEIGIIQDQYTVQTFPHGYSTAMAVGNLVYGDNVSTKGVTPIENILALSRYPAISPANFAFFALVKQLPHLADRYQHGIPTLLTTESRDQTATPDQGAVSPRITLEIIRNMIMHQKPGGILSGKSYSELFDLNTALATKLFVGTEKAVNDSFPRYVDPNTGDALTAKGKIERRANRAQTSWVPTASAYLDADSVIKNS